eukprot:gene2968-5827_t
MNEKESRVLCDLLESTNSKLLPKACLHRTLPLNWDVCSLGWKEFTCEFSAYNSDSIITGIILSHSSLFGSIPSSLGSLEHLSIIDFHGNSLKGNVPSNLGNLHHLKILNLANNFLTGEMPQSLCDSTSVEYMELSSNNGLHCVNYAIKINSLSESTFPVEFELLTNYVASPTGNPTQAPFSFPTGTPSSPSEVPMMSPTGTPISNYFVGETLSPTTIRVVAAAASGGFLVDDPQQAAVVLSGSAAAFVLLILRKKLEAAVAAGELLLEEDFDAEVKPKEQNGRERLRLPLSEVLLYITKKQFVRKAQAPKLSRVISDNRNSPSPPHKDFYSDLNLAQPSSSPEEKRTRAFILIGPCVKNKEVMLQHIRTIPCASDIRIVSEGIIDGPTIEKEKMVDEHFNIASNCALKTDPKHLLLRLKKDISTNFKSVFGRSWESLVGNAEVVNAAKACVELGVDHFGLAELWREAERSKQVVRLERGVYCGLLRRKTSKRGGGGGRSGDNNDVFCMNGFYGELRSQYVSAHSSVQYMELEWDDACLSWKSFLRQVVGRKRGLHRSSEEEWYSSIHGILSREWESLGLDRAPVDGEDEDERAAVQVSLSAFEALVQRHIWLGRSYSTDEYGQELLRYGLSEQNFLDWVEEPIVGGQHLMELMKDYNGKDCVNVIKTLLRTAQDKANQYGGELSALSKILSLSQSKDYTYYNNGVGSSSSRSGHDHRENAALKSKTTRGIYSNAKKPLDASPEEYSNHASDYYSSGNVKRKKDHTDFQSPGLSDCSTINFVEESWQTADKSFPSPVAAFPSETKSAIRPKYNGSGGISEKGSTEDNRTTGFRSIQTQRNRRMRKIANTSTAATTTTNTATHSNKPLSDKSTGNKVVRNLNSELAKSSHIPGEGSPVVSSAGSPTFRINVNASGGSPGKL